MRHPTCTLLRVTLPRRAFGARSDAYSWEWLWEAGSYFDRLSDLLEQAHHHVIFVGWQVDSRLPLRGETLKNKILRLVESKPDFHAYFLIWDHAYFYMLEREPMQGRIWDEIHPRVHFVFDNRHPFGASHHEKLVLIDGKVALCGGIDLCDERWDSPQHHYIDPRRSLDAHQENHGPYHDLAVQISGPVCSALYGHVASRWRQLTTLPFPKPMRLHAAPAGHRVYLSRTQIDLEYPQISMIREVEFLFRELIHLAQHRLVIEGQYFWSKRIARLLIDKMEERARARQPGEPPFQLILTLSDLAPVKSLTRIMAPYQLSLLIALQKAGRKTGTDFRLRTPIVLPPEGQGRSKPVYVHSKIIVVDDRFVSIGSGNLSARTLRVDTELTLTLEARNSAEHSQIRRLSNELEAHWNHGSMRLREIQAAHEWIELRRKFPIRSRIPWQLFFDPGLPWFFPMRWRFRRLEIAHPTAAALSIALVWLSGVVACLVLSGLSSRTDAPHWAYAYATLGATSWLLPIPLFLVMTMAVFSIGVDTAVRVGVISLWVSGVFGYAWGRVFPRSAERYFTATGYRIPLPLGSRTFQRVAQVILNPRYSVQAKAVGQGFYSIYLPWFVFGTLLVLPGAMTVLLRSVHACFPGRFENADLVTVLAFCFSLRRRK